MWATPMTLLFRLASRTPVQQAGQLLSMPVSSVCKHAAISSGLDLSGLLEVLGMGIHLSQHSSDPVVLYAELLDPLLVVSSGLVRYGHVLELSFLSEVDVVHGACGASWEWTYPGPMNRSPVIIPYIRYGSDWTTVMI